VEAHYHHLVQHPWRLHPAWSGIRAVPEGQGLERGQPIAKRDSAIGVIRQRGMIMSKLDLRLLETLIIPYGWFGGVG